MRYKIMMIGIILISFNSVLALKDPSAVYCEGMGYEFVVDSTGMGETGICKFSETESCSALEFLIGKCGEEYSYCSEIGYQLKAVKDPEKCSSIPFYTDCSVCVLEGGIEIEVTKMMGLSFEEGVCGDGKCVVGESYETCPQDCPSGLGDNYCDMERDGICDPDCKAEEDWDCLMRLACGDGKCVVGESYETCPQDCPPEPKVDTLILIIALAVIISGVILFKKKPVKEWEKLYKKWKTGK